MRGLGRTSSETTGLRDLGDQAREVMDRRLRADSRRPLAVAFSGGGDSLALLILAQAWAARTRRPVTALSVDHGLNPDSGRWLDACARTADRLGVRFEALAWRGEKPAAGLPAAARAARHRLLADAARETRAGVILLGHTADDVIEARLMREAGGSTPSPVEWSPSPAWPEGRGLFVLRPLLSTRRAEIRAWLARRGESWIDDPANADLRFARPRVRRAAADHPAEPAPQPAVLPLAEAVTEQAGAFRLGLDRFRAAADAEAERVLAIACVCAGGGTRPPDGTRVRALAARLADGQSFAATLAGARVQSAADEVLICREPGEAARGGLGARALPVGEAVVWDGRFQLEAAQAGLSVQRLAGLARRLPKAERAALLELPPAVRGGLPAIVAADGAVACPLLGAVSGVKATSLAGERLRAACGLIPREPD